MEHLKVSAQKHQQRASSSGRRPEGADHSYAINEDEKQQGRLCQFCLKKEGGDMLSGGSPRDDVSQSTMAAPSNKAWDG